MELTKRWVQVVSTPILSIGPLTAGLAVSNTGAGARVEATIDTHLGPLSLTIQDIGVRFELARTLPMHRPPRR